MRILERLEYDRPILMRDKLDVIWEKATPKESEKKSIHTSIDYEESAYAIMDEDISPKRK